MEIRAKIARGGIWTAGKLIGCARTLWKFAVSRGYAARNIASDVKMPKAEAVVDTGVIDSNILSPHEVELMLAAAPPEHRTAIRFLFDTGVRYAELLGLG